MSNTATAQTVNGAARTARGGIVHGAAQMAAHVYDHAKGGKDSVWLVWMDEDRRLSWDLAPSCIQDRPATAAGLNARVRNVVKARARRQEGLGCYAVVHYRSKDTARADAADKTVADWLANGYGVYNYLPDFMLTEKADGELSRGFDWLFFVDYIVLRPDGGFLSMRESGMVEMDGGDRP